MMKYSLYEVIQETTRKNPRYQFITMIINNGDMFNDVYNLVRKAQIMGITSINIYDNEAWIITPDKSYRVDIESEFHTNYGTQVRW